MIIPDSTRQIDKCCHQYIRKNESTKAATELHSPPLHTWREGDTERETAEEGDEESEEKTSTSH